VITDEYLVIYIFNFNDQKTTHIFIVLILLCLFGVLIFRHEMLFKNRRNYCFFEIFFQLMIESDHLQFFAIFFIRELA